MKRNLSYEKIYLLYFVFISSGVALSQIRNK